MVKANPRATDLTKNSDYKSYNLHSPLDISYNLHRPLDISYNLHSPLDISYNPHSPLDKSYNLHSPLDISYNLHSPLDIVTVSQADWPKNRGSFPLQMTMFPAF